MSIFKNEALAMVMGFWGIQLLGLLAALFLPHFLQKMTGLI